MLLSHFGHDRSEYSTVYRRDSEVIKNTSKVALPFEPTIFDYIE